MILHVFDDTFTYRGRLQNWLNLTWTEEYTGVGKFSLVTYDTDEYAALLRKDWYYYREDRPAAMMAVKVERDTTKNQITVGGYTATHMLSWRIIMLPHTYTNVEAGIYDLILNNLRGLDKLACAEAKGLTDECDCTIEGCVMLEGVTTMLNESNYGIRANFDRANKRHVIEVYEGVDRTYSAENGGTVFSQEFGNLNGLIVTEDADLYKNVAYITGKPNNVNATIYYQYVPPYAGEMNEWREVLVDGDDQTDEETRDAWFQRQKRIGMEALQEHKNAMSFEVELPVDDFGTKYDLGDKVTCKSKRYGLQFDTRITEYQYTYKQGVETVKLTLGDKPLNYVKGEIIRHG